MSGDRRMARRAQRRQRRRWWQGATAAVAGVAILTGLSVVPVASPTLASWVDSEWVGGGFSVLDCAAPEAGTFAAQSQGTLLSGSVLGTDLDAIAEVEDALIVNDGTLVQPSDTVFAPLSVEALEAVQLALGNSLQLPLDTQTGLVGQYAQATSDGAMTGASGTITDVGAIALDDPSGGYPELAELKLSELLKSAGYDVETLLGSNVADVSLGAGAVAGRATLDACDAAFAGITADTLSRDYLVSDVTTTVDSPAVGALVDGVDGVLTGLEAGVNGLASNDSVLSGIAAGVSSLLGGVLGTLRLGDITVGISATIDLDGVRAFLDEPIRDDGGVLTIAPRDGTVTVNTAALLEAAYPGQYSDGLNGLPPNTNLLRDPAIVTALTNALGAILDGWFTEVQSLVTGALDAVVLDVQVVIDVETRPLGIWIPLAKITALVQGSLGDLLLGEGQVTASSSILGLPILDPLLNGLIGGLGKTVGTVVDGVLRPLATLGTAVTDLIQPIVTAVSTVYNRLFLAGIVSITINAQNAPLAGTPGPAEWTTLPDGRYDVSAIRIGMLDAAGGAGVALHLGRASVGPACLAVLIDAEGTCLESISAERAIHMPRLTGPAPLRLNAWQ